MDNQAADTGERFKGLKWFLGILFFTFFSSLLFNYALFIIASKEKMVPIISKTLAIVIDQEGADKVVPVVNYLNELSKHKTELAAAGSELQSINQADIEKEMAGMNEAQQEKYIEDKFSNQLYNSTKLVNDLKAVNPNTQIETEKLDFLSFITGTAHDRLATMLKYQVGITLLLLIAIVLIGAGWGRLSFPAGWIFLAGIPGLILTGYLKPLVSRFVEPYLGEMVNNATYTRISDEVIYSALSELKNIYLLTTLAGLSLFIIGKALSMILKKQETAPVNNT